MLWYFYAAVELEGATEHSYYVWKHGSDEDQKQYHLRYESS